MRKISLEFSGSRAPELFRISFSHPQLNEEILAVRGKTGGAYSSNRTFQWTPAVKALSILLLKSAQAKHRLKENSKNIWPLLEGSTSTPASSLDYALSKEPAWLIDVFGHDALGKPLLRKLFTRTNPDRKRPGPTAVSLNNTHWRETIFEVRHRGEKIRTPDGLQYLAETIENNWQSYKRNSTAVLKKEKSEPRNDLPLKERFREILLCEVSGALDFSYIFSETQSKTTIETITSEESFRKVSGNARSLLHQVDVELVQSTPFGIPRDNSEREESLLYETPLRVAIPSPMPASVALFYYLKYVKGYPLEINTEDPHAVQIARKLVCGNYAPTPDICCIGTAPAATLIAQSSAHEFEPAMLLPRVSQRIVAAGRCSNDFSSLNHGEYLLIRDDPSIPSFIYDELSRNGHLKKNKTKQSHMEPDQVLERLRKGNPDDKAILFFPHYHFNDWFNDCSFIPDPRQRPNSQECILFLHRSLYSDKNKVRQLDIAIRKAWLELKTNHQALRQIVHKMVESPVYLKHLLHHGGLENLSLPLTSESPGEIPL